MLLTLSHLAKAGGLILERDANHCAGVKRAVVATVPSITGPESAAGTAGFRLSQLHSCLPSRWSLCGRHSLTAGIQR